MAYNSKLSLLVCILSVSLFLSIAFSQAYDRGEPWKEYQQCQKKCTQQPTQQQLQCQKSCDEKYKEQQTEEADKSFNLLKEKLSCAPVLALLDVLKESIESLRKHAKYQRKMFDQAVQLVRPGGVLVYSTCTINPGENEALVRYALDRYKFLSLAPQNPRIGGPGLVGKCELFDGEISEEWLRPGEEQFVQRFDPSSELDTIGFFIAKFSVGQKDS